MVFLQGVLNIRRPVQSHQGGFFYISEHAHCRMNQRGISMEMIELAMTYGRVRHDRGAWKYIVGDKEIRQWKARVPAILRCRGIHVVVKGRCIRTVYRNVKLPRARRTYRPLHKGRRSIRYAHALLRQKEKVGA